MVRVVFGTALLVGGLFAVVGGLLATCTAGSEWERTLVILTGTVAFGLGSALLEGDE